MQSIYMICHAEKFLLSLTPKSGQQMHPSAQLLKSLGTTGLEQGPTGPLDINHNETNLEWNAKSRCLE